MPSCALSRVPSPHTSCRSSPRCGTSLSQAHQCIPSTREYITSPRNGWKDLHHCHKDTASLLPSMNWVGPRERACVCSNTTIVSLPIQRDCILEHTACDPREITTAWKVWGGNCIPQINPLYATPGSSVHDIHCCVHSQKPRPTMSSSWEATMRPQFADVTFPSYESNSTSLSDPVQVLPARASIVHSVTCP